MREKEEHADERERSRRNIRLLLEYDGSAFHGWQVQPRCTTIQEVLQEALLTITGEKTVLRGSGRTDAGVHALGQVANFFTSKGHHPDVYRRALNSMTPPGIVVLAADLVADDFDSQHCAQGKTYQYRILVRPSPAALEYGRVWHVPYGLKVGLMRHAAVCLVGTHDFSSFQASGCNARDPVRTITGLSLYRRRDHLFVDITGSGFLRYMVRNIVGTLVDIGRGYRLKGVMATILDAKNRLHAGQTAPPQGLYLVSVDYPPRYERLSSEAAEREG